MVEPRDTGGDATSALVGIALKRYGNLLCDNASRSQFFLFMEGFQRACVIGALDLCFPYTRNSETTQFGKVNLEVNYYVKSTTF
ncbi:MAG: hypothetical protein R2873_30160 [Caldilineaceae bacterium]|nr:hypothetical protein [Caldilineaceae bacterium]